MTSSLFLVLVPLMLLGCSDNDPARPGTIAVSPNGAQNLPELVQGENGRQTRKIHLKTTLTEPLGPVDNNLPKGTMTIINYNAEKFDDLEIFIFTAKGLVDLQGSAVWGLYLTKSSSAAAYVPGDLVQRFLFNVDFNGSWHSWVYPVAVTEGWSDFPTLTVFVVIEFDDGRQFIPGLDLVVLEGTSTIVAESKIDPFDLDPEPGTGPTP